MRQIGDCPFGFEDGRILGYMAEGGQLILEYEFWNDRLGKLEFEGLIGLEDLGGVGVEVGAADVVDTSDLISKLMSRLYEMTPEKITWKEYRFLDLDGGVMFRVVAESCGCVIEEA